MSPYVLAPIVMLGIVALVAVFVYFVSRPTLHEIERDKQIAVDKKSGWKLISNSRFGQSMFVCPICGALTVHESKAKHLEYHGFTKVEKTHD